MQNQPLHWQPSKPVRGERSRIAVSDGGAGGGGAAAAAAPRRGDGGVVGGVEEAVAHRGAGHLPADRAVRDQRRLASLHRPPRRPRARRLLHRRHRGRRVQLRIPGTLLALLHFAPTASSKNFAMHTY